MHFSVRVSSAFLKNFKEFSFYFDGICRRVGVPACDVRSQGNPAPGCSHRTGVPLIIILYSRGVHAGELVRGIAFVDTGRSRKPQVLATQGHWLTYRSCSNA